MAEHEHGTMNIRVHEKTFEGFIKVVERSVIAIVVVLLILAIFGA